ncbi:hypothetical protein C1884_19760 [Pseudomonas sp. GW460-R15]|nr:hypothetical protein C1887_19310 [Pseudomonas sp. GW456-R21]POA64822.1 hypothetical protein C1884_19760 [Pseudomonas sp. GW460-R15]
MRNRRSNAAGPILWRGSLLPLGCEAALGQLLHFFSQSVSANITTASRSNGAVRRSDKPPRHNNSGVSSSRRGPSGGWLRPDADQPLQPAGCPG